MDDSPLNRPHPDDEDPEGFFGEQGKEAVATLDGEPEPTIEPPDDPIEPPAEEPGKQEAPAARQEAPQEPQKARGAASRAYKVFHELALTPDVLRALLKEAEGSKDPSFRVAYFELGEEDARTNPDALKAAYRTHREALGSQVRLASVSKRSWVVKPVGARPVQDEKIEVGD